MKSHTKSSITLPAPELKLVLQLMRSLKLKTKVDVIRKGLQSLKDSVDRAALREAYQKASNAVRPSTDAELKDLEGLAVEGLN